VDAVEQARMKRMEEEYWWHVGRRYLIRRTLEQHLPAGDLDVLDVGCGSGRNLQLLGQFGRVQGVEPEGPGLDACRADGLTNVVAGSADAIPFPDASFDLLTSLDVLEHLDDDDAGVAEIHRVLRPGGHALITVPAYRFLWSVHDEALGHRRRYVASEVHNLLNNHGFTLVRRTYAISFALPAILAFRVAQGLFPPLHERGASYVEVGAGPNWLLTQALKLESRVLGRMDLPLGASILALARKA
jgi:SAM-dependent methyltransferase